MCVVFYCIDCWIFDEVESGMLWFFELLDVLGSKSWDLLLLCIVMWVLLFECSMGECWNFVNIYFDYWGEIVCFESVWIVYDLVKVFVFLVLVFVFGDFNVGEESVFMFVLL